MTLLIASLLHLASVASAQAPVDDIEKVRENLKTALGYRDQAAKELSLWHTQESEVDSLTTLAAEEEKSLKPTIDASQDLLGELSTRRASLEKRAATRAAVEALLAERLEAIRLRLNRQHAVWPEPLRSSTLAQLERLNLAHSPTDPTATRKALDAALEVIETAGEFQGGVNRSTLIRTLADGREGLFEVIFFGLAIGYYHSEEIDQAGMIVFENDQWSWKRDDSLLAPLARFSAVLRGSEQAQLISLPAKLTGTSTGSRP